MGALRGCQHLSVVAIRRGGSELTTRPVEPTTAVEVILYMLSRLLRLKIEVCRFNG
jgi:hypothetical protein